MVESILLLSNLLLWFQSQNLNPSRRCEWYLTFRLVWKLVVKYQVHSYKWNKVWLFLQKKPQDITASFITIIYISVHRYIHSYISVLHFVSLLYIYIYNNPYPSHSELHAFRVYSGFGVVIVSLFSKNISEVRAKNRVESRQE